MPDVWWKRRVTSEGVGEIGAVGGVFRLVRDEFRFGGEGELAEVARCVNILCTEAVEFTIVERVCGQHGGEEFTHPRECAVDESAGGAVAGSIAYLGHIA